MVKKGDGNAYTLSETPSSKVCNFNIYKGKYKDTNLYANRQQNCLLKMGDMKIRDILGISKSIFNYLFSKRIRIISEYLLSAMTV